MNDIILKAIKFARQKHVGQTRKFTGDDYVIHPIQVAEFVMMYGGTDNQIAAALLHDVLEDTDTTYNEIQRNFGTCIADLVKELTTHVSDKSQKGKILSQKIREMSSEARTIKLLDRLHNVRGFIKATPTFIEKYKAETELILDSIEDILSPIQLEIVEKIREVIAIY